MARYAIGLLAIGVLACAVLLTAAGHAGSGAGGLLTREQLAGNPAVSTSYPGSMTLDGKPAGRVAEYADPERAAGSTPSPCSGKGCIPSRAHNGSAMRLLAAPATRQQILHWYLERLLHQGWQYDGRFGTGLPEDHFEVFRSEEIIDVATWAQTDVTSYFLRDQVSHLPTLLASGRKLTVYSVELQACGRCRLSPYSHASPRPAPTIDLSPSCPEPYVSAQVQLSGAFSGSIDHTCGGGDGKPCEALTRPPVWHLEYLNLAINGHEVYLDSTKLRIAGPYTSDEQHWFYRPGPYYEPPQVSGGSIHLHVEFHQRMDLQDPPETLDVTAPCTSWFG